METVQALYFLSIRGSATVASLQEGSRMYRAAIARPNPRDVFSESSAPSSNGTKTIVVHGFGPFFGAPDSSPFVIKTMMLLKLAGLPYRVLRSNPLKAPRK